MATNVTLTMSDLIEETLAFLMRAQERPRVVTENGTGVTAVATSLTLATASDAGLTPATSVIEWDSELMLVTDANTGTGVLTVSRGYAGTTAAAHSSTSIRVNPQYPRHEILRRLKQFFTGPANTYLPRFEVSTLAPATDAVHYVALPADTVSVDEVRYWSPSAGRLVHLGLWEMHENLDLTDFPTGKILMLSTAVSATDEVIVTSRHPHQFLDSDGTTEIAVSAVAENSKIQITYGTEHLPALYAAASLVTGREVGRLEVDYIEEWNQDEAIRQNIPVRYIQQLWTQFYRGLDEARRNQYRPKRRPYRKMQGIGL